MRTTLSIDDDALEQVRTFAEGRKISLGRAASELIRRGVNRPIPVKIVNGLHVFDPGPGSPEITSERVKELLDQEYEEEAKRALPLMHGKKRRR